MFDVKMNEVSSEFRQHCQQPVVADNRQSFDLLVKAFDKLQMINCGFQVQPTRKRLGEDHHSG